MQALMKRHSSTGAGFLSGAEAETTRRLSCPNGKHMTVVA
jgi:hypothetical protein